MKKKLKIAMFSFVLINLFLLITISCKRDDDNDNDIDNDNNNNNSTIQIPALSTNTVTSITQNSSTCGGSISNDGGSSITNRGVCWGTSVSPTLNNNTTSDGSGTGSYTSSITGLTPNTTYHVRAYASNSAGTGYGNDVSFTTTSPPTVSIGDSYQGGIVAYILQPGDIGYNSNIQHGIIAAPYDQGTAKWGCYGTMIGGTSQAIGTGQTNTTYIVNGCYTSGIAARLCDNLVLNGYSDWYLPSWYELNKLWVNHNSIGNFVSSYYWTSTERNANDAYLCNFNEAGTGNYPKDYIYYVRAVRSF